MKSNCLPLMDMQINPNFWTAVITPGDVPSSGLSSGSVFLLIFFTVLFVYCLGGAVYNTKRKGTKGMESIPNIDTWRALPGNIKAGCSFTKAKLTGKGAASPSSAYDSVA
jgi:hypothetical protein